MKRNLSLLIAIGCLLWTAKPLQAFVVSDNNLTSSTLPDFSSSGNPAAYSFSVVGGRLYALQGSIASTTTGINFGPYYIAGVSQTSAPASEGDLKAFLKWAGTNAAAYPATQTTFRFGTRPGDTDYNLVLGMGRFDSFNSAGYSWAATGLKLYTSSGAGNNLVPNASFEDTSVSFWSAGGAFVSDPGKHGSTVWQIGTTTTSYIAVPVVAGQEYFFSFWAASPVIGNGHKIEYGFSVPQNGFSIGTGNEVITRYIGGGNIAWTEYTGTFIPTEDQTTWYLGGMANGGALMFDSIHLAAIPEPGFCLLFAAGGALALWARRRTR